MIQVAQIIEERAVFASSTVRTWVRMYGNPAVPRTRATLSDLLSRLGTRLSVSDCFLVTEIKLARVANLRQEKV
jgi:hypothetical protein